MIFLSIGCDFLAFIGNGIVRISFMTNKLRSVYAGLFVSFLGHLCFFSQSPASPEGVI